MKSEMHYLKYILILTIWLTMTIVLGIPTMIEYGKYRGINLNNTISENITCNITGFHTINTTCLIPCYLTKHEYHRGKYAECHFICQNLYVECDNNKTEMEIENLFVGTSYIEYIEKYYPLNKIISCHYRRYDPKKCNSKLLTYSGVNILFFFIIIPTASVLSLIIILIYILINVVKKRSEEYEVIVSINQ